MGMGAASFLPCLCRFPFVVWYRFWVLPSRVLSCVLSAWGAMAHAAAEAGAARVVVVRQFRRGWLRLRLLDAT